MKHLIASLFVLISLATMAQDSITCSKCLIRINDEMTGRNMVTTKNIILSEDGGKTGIAISFMYTSNTVAINMVAAGGGCIPDNSTVYFLFTDGTRLEISSSSEFNCKGELEIYFGDVFGNESELQELRTKQIKAMRVSTRDSYVQKSFTTVQAGNFKTWLNCIAKESEKKAKASDF